MLNVKLLSAVLSFFAVIGCTAINKVDYSSPYTTPRVGTIVELYQELPIRSGVRAYLQGGHQLNFNEVNKLRPYCQFYVVRARNELHQPYTIEPDAFFVDRVWRRKDSVAVEGVVVASEGGDVRNRGSSQRTMSTYMELSSENQPDVTQLICSRWADPQTRYHVSVEQIISSLGGAAQFMPPR